MFLFSRLLFTSHSTVVPDLRPISDPIARDFADAELVDADELRTRYYKIGTFLVLRQLSNRVALTVLTCPLSRRDCRSCRKVVM